MDSLQGLLSDLTGGDDASAEAAVPRIAKIGPPALPSLLALAHASDPDQRWWATRCLAEIDEPHAHEALRSALKDPSTSVRECAALALRQHPSIQAVPDLLRALECGTPLLMRLAADALAACGPGAIMALTQAARSPDPAVRIEAVRALAATNDPTAIPALYRALDDQSSLVEHWAVQGLDRLGLGMEYFQP